MFPVPDCSFSGVEEELARLELLPVSVDKMSWSSSTRKGKDMNLRIQ